MAEAKCTRPHSPDCIQASKQVPVMRRGCPRKTSVLVGAILCVVFNTAIAEAAVKSIDQYLSRSRVLLLFAPNGTDPALLRQRAILAKAGPAAAERDLLAVEVIGNDPWDAGLRHKFDAGIDRFRAVLVGKDGGAKMTSAEPFEATRLFEVIDAMPMRRGERATRKPDHK